MSGGGGLSPFILIKSAGEMASGIAWRLHQANLRRLLMLDLPDPLCVRRTVSFCPALEGPPMTVEGVTAIEARDAPGIKAAWRESRIPVMRVSDWPGLDVTPPDAVFDAILAKRNTGTLIGDAPLVVGLGPGFRAGVDCHLVIETNRGHNLGRLIEEGYAEPNTGQPGDIAGYTAQRVLRAPADGLFATQKRIGDLVRQGETVGEVAGQPVTAGLDGVIRGLIRHATPVPKGLKLGDVDPRGDFAYCHTISDKARALGGAALEAVMRRFNRP
jgi:xanthine dehydrogenase accessory factor